MDVKIRRDPVRDNEKIPTDQVNQRLRGKTMNYTQENGKLKAVELIEGATAEEKKNGKTGKIRLEITVGDVKEIHSALQAAARVATAISAMYEEDGENVFTPEQVYRQRTGREANAEQRKRETEAIRAGTEILIRIDNSEECDIHPKRTRFNKTAPMIDAREQKYERKGATGDITAFKIRSKPILNDYAESIKQEIDYPVDAIRAGGSTSETTSELTEIIAQRIKWAKDQYRRKGIDEHYIPYSDLYEILPKDEQGVAALRKRRWKIRERTLNILESLKRCNVISDYRNDTEDKRFYIIIDEHTDQRDETED